MLVQIDRVRIAFPQLFKAQARNKGDTPYRSALFPIEPKSKNAKILDEAIEKISKESFGPKWEGALERIVKAGDIFFKKAEYVNKDGEVYDGFEGMYSARGSNRGRVIVVDRKGNPIDEDDGIIYAGCIVNVQFDAWVQDNEFGRKINGKLLAVQFVADAEPFGGGVRVGVDTFKPIDEEEEEDADIG